MRGRKRASACSKCFRATCVRAAAMDRRSTAGQCQQDEVRTEAHAWHEAILPTRKRTKTTSAPKQNNEYPLRIEILLHGEHGRLATHRSDLGAREARSLPRNHASHTNQHGAMQKGSIELRIACVRAVQLSTSRREPQRPRRANEQEQQSSRRTLEARCFGSTSAACAMRRSSIAKISAVLRANACKTTTNPIN